MFSSSIVNYPERRRNEEAARRREEEDRLKAEEEMRRQEEEMQRLMAEELRKKEEQEASQKWKKEELLRQQEEERERLERGKRLHIICHSELNDILKSDFGSDTVAKTMNSGRCYHLNRTSIERRPLLGECRHLH